MGLMSEQSELKACQAQVSEASDFWRVSGGENMTPEDRSIYEQMLARVDIATARHDAARLGERD
jgi:hypothetical protein